MSSLVVKIVGLAGGVALLAAIGGSFLPRGPKTAPQKERIMRTSQAAGASNVRQRAAEAEALRSPEPTVSGNQPPVVLSPTAEETAAADQPSQTISYSGTAPVPQTVFADVNDAAAPVDAGTGADAGSDE